MKTTPTSRKIGDLLTDMREKTLIPNPEFQRRLVWSNKHKNAFIKTVLGGYPFPEIYIAAGKVDLDTGKRTVMLVDGQQRLGTLRQYNEGSEDLVLSKGISPYNKLTDEQKEAFLDYDVVVRDLGKIGMSEVIKIFEQINSVNYALNAMEHHNARYDGEIKQFAEELSRHAFFKNRLVFYINEIRRMGDVRFMLSLIITVMSTYFSQDREHESFLIHYNDEFEEKQRLKTEFDEVFHFISECNLPDDCRAWRKTDLFTLIVEVYRALFKEEKNIKPLEVSIHLLKFYDLVDTSTKTNSDLEKEHTVIQEYHNAALQGTQNRTNRIKRGKIIKDVINGEFSFNPK